MLNLVYPPTTAPLLGPASQSGTSLPSGRKAESIQSAKSPQSAPAEGAASTPEWFPVVEPSGIVVAQALRSYCHGGSMALHPVVHLHIINHNGELYLQRRSHSKKLLPLYWDTAVGGHVSYGESIMEALVRETGEELGLFEFNPHYLRTYVYESERERELVNVFAAVGDFSPNPDPDELEEGRYWTFDDIRQAMGKGILTPNFEQEFNAVSDMLLSLL